MESYGSLETHLRKVRSGGRKILVPYVTAGYSPEWIDTLHHVAAAGADAIEVGIPFSDPIMDGPIIQAASTMALGRGVTPLSLLNELSSESFDVPLVVMTYCNLLFHAGIERFGGWLSEAKVSGTIFPDLPLEESEEWSNYAASKDIDNVMLVSPVTSEERARTIASRSRGFVYGIGLMGVTGVRSTLEESASQIATRLKAVTDRPVLVGIGISNKDQAHTVGSIADGVIVGSALVKLLINGGGPQGAFDFISSLREGLDEIDG